MLFTKSAVIAFLLQAGISTVVHAEDLEAQRNKENQELFHKWSKIKTPMRGQPEPIGTYQAGCLVGAEAMPKDGEGFALMRTSRKRYFAHPSMVTYLHDLSEHLHAEDGSSYLLIGDIGPARGGPMRSGHASHQIGLDADIWLTMSPTRPSKAQREQWSATSYVIGRKTLRKNWSPTQVRMISTAADSPEVNRIFVSPAIKQYFCHTQPSAPWLYKLRPWWAHENHIHVRLNCPEDSMSCVPQDPLDAKNNGCGSDLAWWFSKEADDDWQKIVHDKTPREFPELPSYCEEMIK
jgi:penicillin-insensitive murein endopeptidase